VCFREKDDQEARDWDDDKKMKKFVLYTARFGSPGRFNFPGISIPNVDKFFFTDLDVKSGCHQMIPVRKGEFVKNDFYEIKKINLDHLSSVPVRRQRFVKICIPDEIFDNYEYSIYADCKRPFSFDFDWLLSCLKPESDFLVSRHRKRDCIYDEGMICIKKRRDRKAIILEQLDYYRSENYPAHNGLYASFWLFRRHTKRLKEFSMLWWEQLTNYSLRDQISLPYVAWKHDMKISIYEKSSKILQDQIKGKSAKLINQENFKKNWGSNG